MYVLLLAVLSYHLASLYKHLFNFQARVEQSVPFLLLSLSVLTTVLNRRQAVPDRPAIRESMCPAGCPENTRPLVPQAQAGPIHHSPILGV